MISLDTPLCMLTLGQLWEALTRLNQGAPVNIKPKGISVSTNVKDLGLSFRLTNCLIRLECKTLADVLKISSYEFKRTRGLGRESFKELSDFLTYNGYQFGEFDDE